MVLDTDHTETEQHGNCLVAGVAHRGTEVDEAALWDSLDDYADHLEDAAVSHDRYAVMFDIDADSGEFTYVAGREVDDVDDLAAELTAVEIPSATYAVLEPEHETVNEMVVEIHQEDLDYDENDDVHAPIFERNDGPISADVREIYVPVRDDYTQHQDDRTHNYTRDENADGY